MDSKFYNILLSMVDGLGPRWLAALSKVFGSPEGVWHAADQDLQAIPGIPRKVIADLIDKRDRLDPAQVLADLQRQGIKFIFSDEPVYPPLLKEIHDPPKVLYCKGNPQLLHHPMIAIVGARKASPYGASVAEKLGRELAEAGLGVVSGMARGIDSAAHKGALAVNGTTVAVLGCGVDVVYPPENRRLMSEISEHGVVISEFPPGTRPVPGNFPVRNRIISGLSQGVLIIEAAEKSGSLITADCALEQGRDVFAVPGQITNPLNKGAHKLIKQGAKLVENATDILEELGFDTGRDFPLSGYFGEIDLTVREKSLYNVISDEPVCGEEIIAKTGLDPAEVLSMLLILEMKGVVRQLPGERYIRRI